MTLSPMVVLILSIFGVAIGGADTYYQVHSTGPFTAQFYVGITMAALTPVGAYFVGLAQKTPAEKRAAATQDAGK